MTYPAFIFWILFLIASLANQRTLLILLFSSIAFGSLAVLPPELTGGASFIPKTMFSLLLGVRFVALPLLVAPRRVGQLARPENLGFLLAFLIISLITTIFMPRLFAGMVDIVPLKVVRFASTEPLAPSQTNLTQSIYLSVSVMVTFALAFLARTPKFAEDFLVAVLVGGAVLFGTGLADMAASAVGQADLLEPFRNASYAMIVGAEVSGVRRVVGLMSEASAFGSTCVSFGAALVFLRPSYAAGIPRTAATLVAVSLIAMALLSTSSSAYAGLVFFGAANILNIGRRMMSTSPVSRSGLGIELAAVFVCAIALLTTMLVVPEVFDPLLGVVNEVIFNKASTDSYFERAFWNQISWSAFWSTYGLGVGLGSTRASNLFVAIISNSGMLASGCFFIFLLQTFLRRSSESARSSELMTALKFAVVPFLGMAALGSATPDFEPWTGMLIGAITGLSLQTGRTSSTERYPNVSVAPSRMGLRNIR
jgi:hypothetical protein